MSVDGIARASQADFDLVLVGGGLQNGLISLASLDRDPKRRIALVESGSTLGGNHTWSLHAADAPASALAWLDPLLIARFERYEVRFPGFARTVESAYSVISSARFDAIVQRRLREAPGCALFLGAPASTVGAQRVELSDGRALSGELVIDARGPGAARASEPAGYQKFLGRELQTTAPHGIRHPLLMDATVPQHGGFRFFYVLPLAVDRVLVEDTCFSRSPVLEPDGARAAIDAYVRASLPAAIGARCLREESGVLPMPWSSGEPFDRASPLRAGYAGGYFHPATGYSLPVALRLALHVAAQPSPNMFGPAFERMLHNHLRQARYARELNRLLFHCFAPEDMWNVFARFYRLPEPLLARFYALSMTPWDLTRILVGRPPRGFSLAHAFVASRTS